MNTDQAISRPTTPQLSAWARLFALIPAAINIALIFSPTFSHHLRLQVIATVSGLFAGALMFGWSHRPRVAVSSALMIVGVSHLYLIASVAVAEHLSEVSIMNEMMSVESALWSNFTVATVAMAFLLQETLRVPAKV